MLAHLMSWISSFNSIICNQIKDVTWKEQHKEDQKNAKLDTKGE